MHVQVIREAPDLLVVIMILSILGKVNLIFLDCPDETLGAAVLPGFARISHARLDLGVLKDLGIGRGRELAPLVRRVNLQSGILGVFASQREIARPGSYDRANALADYP